MLGPDANARQELTFWPVLVCELCFLITAYLALNPRLFHLRLWMIPIAFGSIWSLCTRYALFGPSWNSWNFGICAVGVSATIKLIELATLNGPPMYHGQPGCSRRAILCSNCAVNMFSYLLDLRCRHWNNYGVCHVPEDTRRDSSHAEFYTDTFLLLLKCGVYVDAILAFIANIKTSSSQGDTIFRDTLAITSNFNIHLPYPILGALPLTIAVGLLVVNGLEFENYAITLLAAPLTMLPPSISPHSRPASALKSEWPPLFDSPFRSTSLNEFWAKRWQGTPRRGFLVAGANPGKVLGGYTGRFVGKFAGIFSSHEASRNKWENQTQILGSRIGYVMGAFLISGLMHDFGMWGMGQGTDFRRVTGYFLIQGVGVIVERALGLDQLVDPKCKGKSATQANGDGHPIHSLPSRLPSTFRRYLMKLWVFVWVVVPGTMMIEAWLKRGFDLVTLVPSAYSPSRVILDVWNHYAFGQ